MKKNLFVHAFQILFLLVSSKAVASPKSCEKMQKEISTLTDQIKVAIEKNRVADQIPTISYSVFTENCLLAKEILSDRGGAPEGQSLSVDHTLFRAASISKFRTPETLCSFT